MPTPTRHPDTPTAKDWGIAFAALFFCIIVAPCLAAAVAMVVR